MATLKSIIPRACFWNFSVSCWSVDRQRRDASIRGKVRDWFTLYLLNWSQQVSIDG